VECGWPFLQHFPFLVVDLKHSPSQSTSSIQRIRGFGSDALYTFTFYDDITFCGCYYKLVKLDSLALYWNCGSECYTTRDKQSAQKVLLETIAGEDKKVDFLYCECAYFSLANIVCWMLKKDAVKRHAYVCQVSKVKQMDDSSLQHAALLRKLTCRMGSVVLPAAWQWWHCRLYHGRFLPYSKN